MPEPCRLCASDNVCAYARAGGRDYLLCANCDLVFLAKDQLPELAVERAEYGLHENDPADEGYRRHLSKLTDPLQERLQKGARGLDFGCGPGPAISVILGEAGYCVKNYDPAFFPDETLLSRQYDFVTATEVVEHFHNPAREFDLFSHLLADTGATLALMTQMRQPETDFANWHYIREISHVAFYSQRSFQWIAQKFDWTIRFNMPNVVLLQN